MPPRLLREPGGHDGRPPSRRIGLARAFLERPALAEITIRQLVPADEWEVDRDQGRVVAEPIAPEAGDLADGTAGPSRLGLDLIAAEVPRSAGRSSSFSDWSLPAFLVPDQRLANRRSTAPGRTRARPTTCINPSAPNADATRHEPSQVEPRSARRVGVPRSRAGRGDRPSHGLAQHLGLDGLALLPPRLAGESASLSLAPEEVRGPEEVEEAVGAGNDRQGRDEDDQAQQVMLPAPGDIEAQAVLEIHDGDDPDHVPGQDPGDGPGHQEDGPDDGPAGPKYEEQGAEEDGEQGIDAAARLLDAELPARDADHVPLHHVEDPEQVQGRDWRPGWSWPGARRSAPDRDSGAGRPPGRGMPRRAGVGAGAGRLPRRRPPRPGPPSWRPTPATAR